MNAATERLMSEVARRYCQFHAGESPDRAWIGLGTEAHYRPAIDAGLMVFHNGITPYKRCMGWLVLTKAGQAELLKILARAYTESHQSQGMRQLYELLG